jgi:predicted ATPase
MTTPKTAPKRPSKTAPKRPSESKNATALAVKVVKKSMLFNDDSPFRAAVAEAAPALVVVTGENASGKSLYVRVAAAFARQDGVLPVSVSIRERTGAGTEEMGGLRRVMMFGDEQEQSTGATSVGVVETAFNNLKRPQGSLLIVDEPELGLSEAYARALGQHIGQKVQEIPSKCLGALVVTHSRALVRGLIEGFGGLPTHVALAGESTPKAGLEEWLRVSEYHSVDDVLALRDIGLDRWRQVGKLLK